MKGQVFNILFIQDKAFLTPDKPLSLSQAGLPDIADSFKAPAFWKIRVLNLIEAEQKLFCEVLSYNTGETDFPPNQKKLADKLNAIERISFRDINTSGLLGTLGSSRPITILPVRERPPSRPEVLTEPVPESAPEHTAPSLVSEPERRTITETFLVPIKHVRFRLGGVSFDRHFHGFEKSVEINIPNYHIREEFDAVKNYFANILNTTKIQVTATMEVEDDLIRLISAESPEIDLIDEQLIYSVRFEFLKATKKKVVAEVDKSLFTMDEYFDAFGGENFKSNSFYKDERELFEDLLKITNTKHYKQLRFLSGKHCHQLMKLRFIHKPFSFIFLIEGERNYHLVWETLDTEEATYIWHVDKNLQVLKRTLRKIEDIINTIKVHGKTAYINSSEDSFRRIYHDYSEIVEGFIRWKGEVESILT